MTDNLDAGVEAAEPLPIADVIKPAKDRLSERCKAAGLKVEEPLDEMGLHPAVKIHMKNGRDVRALYISLKEIERFLIVPFEKYVFLSDYEAICSYEDDSIEASIRPIGVGAGFVPSSYTFRRLFETEGLDDFASVKIVLDPPNDSMPRIELSPASKAFQQLSRGPARARLTLKLTGCKVTTHDAALATLMKCADSAFFQIDLLSSVTLALERSRRRRTLMRKRPKQLNLAAELQYPKAEYDEAPLSLYWYGRSAFGMPLLQFLAFYQVIEFYFPTYSQAEAQRKLKVILKDPTFRGDRDADIGKLLSAIHVSRSGAFGDERSQLRATLAECVDPSALREFIEGSEERKNFYSAKGKSAYHKLTIGNPALDPRNDVAERIYDIRCKIVHTKNDFKDGEVELLLPFSAEAEQLSFDIELVQFVSQAVLIAGSTPFQSNG